MDNTEFAQLMMTLRMRLLIRLELTYSQRPKVHIFFACSRLEVISWIYCLYNFCAIDLGEAEDEKRLFEDPKSLINLSKDDYENLPKLMKNLVSWEVRNAFWFQLVV